MEGGEEAYWDSVEDVPVEMFLNKLFVKDSGEGKVQYWRPSSNNQK